MATADLARPGPATMRPANELTFSVPQPAPERRHVFVIYTRADREWVARIQRMMQPLLRSGNQKIELWDDSQIKPGAKRRSGIETALAQAALQEGHWGRVFGSAPGAYGAGLQGLIDSGQWESRADLTSAFLNWSQWRYDGEMLAGGSSLVATSGAGGSTQPGTDGDPSNGLQVQRDRGGLEQRLAQVQVVLHNQDNREHDLLDSDDYYQFHGGLSAAVETLSGTKPQLWFADHSRSARPRLHRVEKEFDKVLRSRLLNPRWIEAMQQHGYKGGFEMAASLDYLFAYDASSGRLPDWSYGAISQSWLNNDKVLAFLRRHNPWALRDMAERLLEAEQRGLWEGADPAVIERLRQLVLESEGLIEAG